MRIIVSLLIVLAIGSVWLSSEVDSLRANQAALQSQVEVLGKFNERLSAMEQRIANPFLDADYQQLLGLLQSYLIDSSRYHELSLQHTQMSLSLLLSPNRPANEKRQIQEKLALMKQEAMLIDETRKKTFLAWQQGMEQYEKRIAAEKASAPKANFDERVLEATEQMKALKQNMSETP